VRASFTRTSTVLTQAQAAAPHREGEVLVRFRSGISQPEKDLVSATHGVRKTRKLHGNSGIEKWELPAGKDPKAATLEILANPQVDFAEPNFLISKDDLTPNDPQFNEQWALRNTGQSGGQFGSDINATHAWETTKGSESTVVAVIDSGIDFTHPDLVNNQWTNPRPSEAGDVHGWDYVANSGEIKDEQGHGTAVAGIIAAEGDNSAGITGVMWRASLMSLRVLNNTGTGDVAAAVEAIDYAATQGAHVINMSWGTTGESLALKDAVERAIRRNVVVVCSAGNGGKDLTTTPYYPASYALKGLITVAGSDSSDQLGSWSNFGSGVTIAAPGTDISTTKMGGGYWNVTGTSAAAPIVSGIAGLLKTVRGTANAQAVSKAITDGARQSVSLQGKVASAGIADASAALSKINGPAEQAPDFPRGPTFGSGGNGPGGSFTTTPPPTLTTPGISLPNLNEARNSETEVPKTKAPIESNLPCADCDPYGGGGGGTYYPSGDPNFSTARRRLINETGQRGEDLGSRNFNWSQPLLDLKGRAGLDLSLTLSYNSLVWTKDGSFMKFNADLGSPAPGFRLGLPTLQQKFLNSATGIYAYLMVLPSGARVELRQVSTNIYESQDGNYTHLDDSNASAPVVTMSNGTRLSFTQVSVNSEFRCTQIKDRNGNYISATYNTTNGHLQTITDTLGRLITFVYDANSNLQSIRQTWAGVTHDWATFYYGQVYVAPAFGGGLQVNGPNNNYTTVLTQVNLHDGSYFVFDYNAAFAQITQIKHYAPDTSLLNYTYYNLNTAAGQTECPRFTARRDWARNWNGDDNGVPVTSEEAITTYSAAADNSWTQQTTPDGVIYKEFFATSGWQTGLTTSSETWSGGV
ncbi:MAG TPA: S8 family peptidase, partial [Pyrinomonadaceae bacterium]|nr:S8 family peptidase [Pyrinomonadaceae bacterium]